jgi:hypothetical protein
LDGKPGLLPFPSPSTVKRKQCRPPDCRCPRYRRMEMKGDGRSGALVKLPPSPRAFCCGARICKWHGRALPGTTLSMFVDSGAADTNAVRASSQNGFCAHPIARDQSQHQKTTQFWLLFGPWFHTIEPQFIRMLGIIWGKETRGLGCADLDDGARRRTSWSARFRSFVQRRGRFWLSAKLRGQQS